MPLSEPPRRRVTMRTLAAEAGVHVSTVSRALSDSEKAQAEVGPEVVEKVRRTAARLGYRRNHLAAAMRKQQSRAIGVLVPTLSDVVLATIFGAVDRYVTSRDYQAIVVNTNDDPGEHQRRIDLLLERQIDGLLICDARTGDAVEGAAGGVSSIPEDLPVPVIAVNRTAPGVASVTCGDHEGGRLMAEHLFGKGHRRVAIVGGRPWASTALDRLAGFRAYYESQGCPVPDAAVDLSGFDIVGGRRSTEDLLDSDLRPTAIFAMNDYAALGAFGALRDRGLTVGRDFALAGYNDINVSAELPVPLTSVDSHPDDMGTIAADLLLQTLAGTTVGSVEVRPTLRVRQSTDF